MLLDGLGNLWVGWHNVLGVWRFNRSQAKWRQFTTANSALHDHELMSMALDKEGRIWVGTAEGLTIIAGNETACYGGVIPGEVSPPAHFRVIENELAVKGVGRYFWVGSFVTVDDQGRVWSTSNLGVAVYSESGDYPAL
jgi:ligand-binding sensor domain-containing protein